MRARVEKVDVLGWANSKKERATSGLPKFTTPSENFRLSRVHYWVPQDSCRYRAIHQQNCAILACSTRIPCDFQVENLQKSSSYPQATWLRFSHHSYHHQGVRAYPTPKMSSWRKEKGTTSSQDIPHSLPSLIPISCLGSWRQVVLIFKSNLSKAFGTPCFGEDIWCH